MLKKMAFAPLLALAFAFPAAHAENAPEKNAVLLREYARIAEEINQRLENLGETLNDPYESQQLVLSQKKSAAFCAEATTLVAHLKRKDDLLQPGVLSASEQFHERAEEATVDQVTKFLRLVLQNQAAFRPCSKRH